VCRSASRPGVDGCTWVSAFDGRDPWMSSHVPGRIPPRRRFFRTRSPPRGRVFPFRLVLRPEPRGERIGPFLRRETRFPDPPTLSFFGVPEPTTPPGFRIKKSSELPYSPFPVLDIIPDGWSDDRVAPLALSIRSLLPSFAFPACRARLGPSFFSTRKANRRVGKPSQEISGG
jgi:hypothetical protein